MTQRRRHARAQVERTPSSDELRGIGAALDAAYALVVERRALATTGRVLVAWLIGRWRR